MGVLPDSYPSGPKYCFCRADAPQPRSLPFCPYPRGWANRTPGSPFTLAWLRRGSSRKNCRAFSLAPRDMALNYPLQMALLPGSEMTTTKIKLLYVSESPFSKYISKFCLLLTG
jgi:hypothetical protein